MLRHAGGRVSLHGQRPPPQDTSLLDAVAQSLARSARAINASACAYVAATSRRYCERMAAKNCAYARLGVCSHLLGQGQRLLTPLLGLVGIAQLPEELRHPGEVW